MLSNLYCYKNLHQVSKAHLTAPALGTLLVLFSNFCQGRLCTHFTLNTVAPFSHCIMIPPTLLSCWWLLGMNSTCHGLMSGRKADSQERNPLEKVVKSEQRKVAHRHMILCSREKGVTSCIATDLTSSFSYPRSSCLKNEEQWVI